MRRTIVWFSHGVVSAVLALEAVKRLEGVRIVCCDTTASEHPDNARFRRDCENWWGRPVHFIRSEKYAQVEEVFEATRYMSGPQGARCTTELKKIPRFKFQDPGDVHAFGFAANEKRRIREFVQRNPELRLMWLLRDLGITKTECFQIVQRAGIALPTMYLLGYRNNNCIGCVKSESPGYWQKIQSDFPEVFRRRCEQSRLLGTRLVKIGEERLFLDELPERPFPYKGENISCGPECGGGGHLKKEAA